MRVLPGTCGMSIDARVTPVRELRTAPLRLEGKGPKEALSNRYPRARPRKAFRSRGPLRTSPVTGWS
jgi:hypothetical protein